MLVAVVVPSFLWCDFIPFYRKIHRQVCTQIRSQTLVTNQDLPACMRSFSCVMQRRHPPNSTCKFLKLSNYRYRVTYVNTSTRPQHSIHFKHDGWDITSVHNTNRSVGNQCTLHHIKSHLQIDKIGSNNSANLYLFCSTEKRPAACSKSYVLG